jgi:hypothetical protein
MAELEKRIEELSALTRRKKSNVAVALQQGHEVPASELTGISKLEREIANMEALVRLRELTAEPTT